MLDLPATLRAILPPDRVHADERALVEALHDALDVRRAGSPAALPAAVVRPRHAEDVAAVLRLANERGFAVVPRGGGSGLMGGAEPLSAHAVVLDLRSLDAIAVVKRDRAVRCGAGARLDRVEAACRAEGLTLGHDPWTIRIATVGGAIGANGVGYRAARFGSMGDLVLGVEAVTPSGEVVRAPGVRYASGLSLARLAAGTEGALLVVTEAALRASPRPEARRIVGASFGSFEACVEGVRAVLDADLRPAILEAHEQSRCAAFRFSEDGPPQAFVGFEGPRPLARAAARLARAALSRAGGRPLPAEEVREFWTSRHEIGDAYAAGRRALDGAPPGVRFDFHHVCVPASRLLDLDREVSRALAAERLARIERGLFGEDGLYALTLVDPAEGGDDPGRLRRFSRALHEIAASLGGSVEAIHGIGTYVRDDHARLAPGPSLVARAVKAALDPRGVLNPGKGAAASGVV